MSENLSRLTIDVSATLKDALIAIDRGHSGIVLVSGPDGKMEGLMTDGDLRRMLLAGKTMESPVAKSLRKNFTTVSPEVSRADVLDLMQALSIEHVPILDASGRAVGLHRIGNILSKRTLPNWAVIMAGGRGTRLGELTQETPKPMLKVAGRPILERIILHLVGAGIRKIFISINYLGHVIEEYFRDGENFGCEIHYLREEEPLGTGGALRLLPELPQTPLLVMNGDLVTDFNVGRMLGHHQRGNHVATMGLIPYNHRVPFGCVEVEDGSVTTFREKPVLSQLVNCGIYAVSPELIQDIPSGLFPITELFENALGTGRSIGAFVIEDDWKDIGLPDELKLAQGKI